MSLRGGPGGVAATMPVTMAAVTERNQIRESGHFADLGTDRWMEVEKLVGGTIEGDGGVGRFQSRRTAGRRLDPDRQREPRRRIDADDPGPTVEFGLRGETTSSCTGRPAT